MRSTGAFGESYGPGRDPGMSPVSGFFLKYRNRYPAGTCGQ